jgi:methionine sulfoxide reductase heme-binding subunit
MMLAAAGSNSTAMWYLTRGTGAVALLLLTASLAFGIADVARWSSPRWPRFVIDAVHGTLSLAAVVLVGAHVVTSVLDPFAPIRLTDAVIPFAGRYRPVWLGLGAVAFDLLLALIVTSLLRRRIGARAWRAVHWTAYACWPLALVHTLGTGSDVRRGWMLILALGCTAVVAVAIGVRVAATAPRRGQARALTVAALIIGAIALALWLPRGPLGQNWARRAGTPVALLTHPTTAVAATKGQTASPGFRVPFNAQAHGTLRSGISSDGTALIDIALRLPGASQGRLDVRLQGQPLDDGGVRVQRSQVTLGPRADPARYIGQVVTLDATTLDARVQPVHGRAVRVHAILDLGARRDGGQVSATVSAQREAGP